jgi:anti-sigma B factor antagonist
LRARAVGREACSVMSTTSLVAVRVAGDTQVLVVRGVVDRHAAREIDYLIRHGTSDPPPRVVIDIARVEEVSGALLGALLRASRRLAWRNRRLTIVCPQPELRRRLDIAGLDELADVTASLDSVQGIS